LALALAETVQSLGGGRLLRALPQAQALVAETESHREAIRSLIQKLEAAQQNKDSAAWDAAATEAVSHGDKIRAAYLTAIPIPRARQRLEAFYEEMLSGKHGHEGHR
jgi:Skp family chaperone for outer membrane proteins